MTRPEIKTNGGDRTTSRPYFVPSFVFLSVPGVAHFHSINSGVGWVALSKHGLYEFGYMDSVLHTRTHAPMAFYVGMICVSMPMIGALILNDPVRHITVVKLSYAANSLRHIGSEL